MNQQPQLTPIPKLVRAGEGQHLALRGEARHQLLDGRDTGGALALALSQFEKGAGSPLHLHTREDEWFCVESGQFHFQIGTQTQTLGAGDVVFGPRGVAHRYAGAAPTPETVSRSESFRQSSVPQHGRCQLPRQRQA